MGLQWFRQLSPVRTSVAASSKLVNAAIHRYFELRAAMIPSQAQTRLHHLKPRLTRD
jgi:hypothetical protein